MHLHTLRPGAKRAKTKKRVGRGISSGLGKTGGRGHKGLKSRSGGNVKPGFEGGQMPLHRRIPKFGLNSAKVTEEVDLSNLAKVDAKVIDIAALKYANVIKTKFAKIVRSGSLQKAIIVRGIKVTKGARNAIENAGGKVE